MICQRCNLTVYTGAHTGPVDADGFELVLPRTNPKLAAKVAKMVKKYNEYWWQNHKLEIHFHFDVEDYRYITLTEPALLRNRLLNAKMASMLLPINPVIVEPFAGCGADTITFLYNMKPRKIYVCDRDYARKMLLQDNVTDFEQANQRKWNDPTDRMDYYVGEANGIFDRVAASRDEISLLYLDPPWVLDDVTGNGPDGEADAAQLVKFLTTEVFEPMHVKNLIPKLIVIKTRFGWKELSQVMDKLPTKGH
jgi:hypothetical protein